MQRFAQAGLWRVLYYEARLAGGLVLVAFWLARYIVSKDGWCFYLAWMSFRLSHRIFLLFTEVT